MGCMGCLKLDDGYWAVAARVCSRIINPRLRRNPLQTSSDGIFMGSQTFLQFKYAEIIKTLEV